jgi:methionine-rich copper-binding protein CopC
MDSTLRDCPKSNANGAFERWCSFAQQFQRFLTLAILPVCVFLITTENGWDPGIKEMRPIRRSAVWTWIVCASLVVVVPAKLYAHAVLVESKPKAGSTVKGPDLPVWLRFNVRVDGSRSRCTLLLPDGSTKVLVLDEQSKPDILTAKATGLSAGKYKLQWQVLAADGHISRGELTFNLD